MKRLFHTRLIFGLRYIYHLLFTRFYHLGRRVTFKAGVVIENGSHISLGNGVYLEKNSILKYLEEFSDRSFPRPNIKIDDQVIISYGTIVAAAKYIHIQKYASIGPYCFIGDHDHEYTNIKVPIKDQGYRNVKDIVIGKGAWIGANCTICSGVTIGKNAVIGANSVVVKDVPAFCVAAGAPARVIKRYNPKTGSWERT